ncbi:Malate/lactate/ureidoglycolate dehydrogenase, LDH2 family [Streptomyces zhaozhouensis]|uniref:Malate/lactate/ureidoglycolate dehydrogenase, LDH2 family n=1 Tax=Streptomyces zhaozhouensis TaxID=1300267 RepID=A0A286DXL7_9ACTN|nr:Ldh family oxidoreductase [Streptomyces zhaozhouensis]SOD63383.1 Malate/lactate/ureidoglycolate dehydrogenase, LDH2 family [Streptomyces zhaozhouensis]
MTAIAGPTVTVAHSRLHSAVGAFLAGHGVPEERALLAAEALVHGDLTGMDSHGVFNLARLYHPLLASGRARPDAEPRIANDLGACLLLDHRRALGLWAAAESMDLAVARARRHGVGLVSVRGATHLGCAGFHAARAARAGLVGVVASNCGGQRIAGPPGGRPALLGTNPLSVAAPALPERPFVLDMSTTVVPTGRVRVAAANGREVPAGWLENADGATVTDPAAFDRGDARLRWLGGTPENGAHKGFGLGLAVELLAALLPGAAVGPVPEALAGDGRPHGTDDDIGLLLLAIDPDMLRAVPGAFADASRSVFATVRDCPPLGEEPVRYPGWWEAERAAERRAHGVPLPAALHSELTELGLELPVLEAHR